MLPRSCKHAEPHAQSPLVWHCTGPSNGHSGCALGPCRQGELLSVQDGAQKHGNVRPPCGVQAASESHRLCPRWWCPTCRGPIGPACLALIAGTARHQSRTLRGCPCRRSCWGAADMPMRWLAFMAWRCGSTNAQITCTRCASLCLSLCGRAGLSHRGLRQVPVDCKLRQCQQASCWNRQLAGMQLSSCSKHNSSCASELQNAASLTQKQYRQVQHSITIC